MHQPQTKKKKAFTLVELIIVITILAILGTIAFISFQGYTKDTRDSVRLTDVKSIYDGLSIYKVQTSTTLLPDDYIEIQSGTTTISYQGYAGVTVQRGINLKNGGTDPLSKNYYIYTTDVSAKKIQLMTYLETADKDVELLSYNYKLDNLTNNLNLINQAYSSNIDTGYYLDKKIYVYGDKIGILTDENNVPLQETTTSTGINLLTNTGNITTYFGGDVYDNGKSTNTGTTLINEINGAINNTLPCSPTTHEGYEITSLQDSQSGSFTKPLTIDYGSGTGTIIATCNNGELTYSEPINNINCITDYIPNGTNDGCIADVCDGNLPLNAELNGTQSLGNMWSYSTISGVCKYQCQNGYHTEDGGVSCISNTKSVSCIQNGKPLNSNYNVGNVNVTWNGSSWNTASNCGWSCVSGYTSNGSSCDVNILNITKSLRFDSSRSAYLYRTPNTISNKTKWTWSGWIKRSSLNNNQYFISAGTSLDSFGGFDSNNRFYFHSSGNGGVYRISNATFTDIFNWYNIIISYDEVGGHHFYINGNEITSWLTNTTNIPNLQGVNSDQEHNIGRYRYNSSNYFNGYMSEINFIDGQALGISDFGVNIGGKWLPKAYLGVYGTNGYHLDFSDSGNLGKDAAGSNDWNLSPGVQSYDQMIDTPTNNFPTWNYNDSISSAGTNPGTFSNGALTYTNVYPPYNGGTGRPSPSRGSIEIPSTGKWYWELKPSYQNVGVDSFLIGISSNDLISGYPSYQRSYYGYNGNLINESGQSAYSTSFSTSNTIGVLVDRDNNTLQFYVDGNPKPVAEGNLPTYSLKPIIGFGSSGSTWTQIGNFGQGGQNGLNWCENAGGYFANCPPAGFKALSSKNIGN